MSFLLLDYDPLCIFIDKDNVYFQMFECTSPLKLGRLWYHTNTTLTRVCNIMFPNIGGSEVGLSLFWRVRNVLQTMTGTQILGPTSHPTNVREHNVREPCQCCVVMILVRMCSQTSENTHCLCLQIYTETHVQKSKRHTTDLKNHGSQRQS